MQISNAQLSTLPILNLSRSGLYWEAIEVSVDVATCTTQFMGKFQTKIYHDVRLV